MAPESLVVYVNGEYHGLYSNVETEDKVFLQRWFSSSDGNLYEEGGSDLVAGAAPLFELETNEARADRRDLEALIAALGAATPVDFVDTVSRELDLKSLNKYLAYEYVPAPNTIFRFIKKLEPGCYLLFHDGAVTTSQYWDAPIEDYPISDRTEQQYIDELKELLEQAVTARLVADVPVGLFVSGGLDSGLVAALARRASRRRRRSLPRPRRGRDRAGGPTASFGRGDRRRR